MSKAVRWQVPFAAHDGTQYRVDIYDEGYSGDPVTLTAGATPFVTDENDSDDFFEPVRSQTGTLQICTKIPSGGMLKLDDILPANNIARPVRLMKIAANNTETIEWQGFLSCEAYNQDYVGIPQTLSLSLLSVLEAMDSVEVDTTRINGLRQTRYQIYDALTELDRQIGMPEPLFTNIYYSVASCSFMTHYIDATILYEINEYTNEETKAYVVSGKSCKKMLTRICTFMGWVCREDAKNIYFNRINEGGNMYTQLLSKFGGSFTQYSDRTIVPITAGNISDLTWRGKGHQRSIAQGAKSVEVVAKLEHYELRLVLPDFPTNDMVHAISNLIESYAQMNVAFSNILTFAYYNIVVRETSGGYDVFADDESDVETTYANCALSPQCVVANYYKRKTTGTQFINYRDVGAFFAMLKFSDGEGGYNWWNGLYIPTANEIYATDQHAPSVFKMDSIIRYRLMDGKLRLKVSALTVVNGGTSLMPFTGKVHMKLQFGSYYWTGSAWTTISSFFEADFANSPIEDDNSDYVLEIPITSSLPLSGSVSMEISGSMKGGVSYPSMGGQPAHYEPFYDLFIYEWELEYVKPEYVTENDRDENKYFRLLGTNFKDEISVETELASSLNNRPSPSIIMSSSSEAMKTMAYVLPDGTTTEQRRPEVDLLNRLATYYGAARQRLELEVAHITTPLPNLKLNGINDGKVYLPLAESRNWRTGVCTLTCFECPQ